MSREIKFRVWDIPNGEWLVESKMDGMFRTPDNGAKSTLQWCVESEDFDVQQYTGLKDKNGKEIYEGDVLATSNDGADGCDVWEKEICGVVKWNRGGHGWIDLPDNDEESMYGFLYVYIIGNIHENPELLK